MPVTAECQTAFWSRGLLYASLLKYISDSSVSGSVPDAYFSKLVGHWGSGEDGCKDGILTHAVSIEITAEEKV